MLLGDSADIERGMAFGGEGVGVECDERIFGLRGFERVVEGQKSGKVVCVRYKRRPY